jgi:hypothetical protein
MINTRKEQYCAHLIPSRWNADQESIVSDAILPFVVAKCPTYLLCGWSRFARHGRPRSSSARARVRKKGSELSIDTNLRSLATSQSSTENREPGVNTWP